MSEAAAPNSDGSYAAASAHWQQIMGVTESGMCVLHPTHQVSQSTETIISESSTEGGVSQELQACPACAQEESMRQSTSNNQAAAAVPTAPTSSSIRVLPQINPSVWGRLVVRHAHYTTETKQLREQVDQQATTIQEQNQTIRALRRTIQQDMKLIKTMATQKQQELQEQQTDSSSAASTPYSSPAKKPLPSLIGPGSESPSPSQSPSKTDPRLKAQMQFFQRASRARGGCGTVLPQDSMRHLTKGAGARNSAAKPASAAQAAVAILEEEDEEDEDESGTEEEEPIEESQAEATETENTFAADDDDDQDIVLPVPSTVMMMHPPQRTASSSSYYTDADRSLASDPTKLFASFRGGLLDIPKSPPPQSHGSSKNAKKSKVQLDPNHLSALQIPAVSRHSGGNATMPATALETPQPTTTTTQGPPSRGVARNKSVDSDAMMELVPTQAPRLGRKKKKPAIKGLGAAMGIANGPGVGGGSKAQKEISIGKLAASLNTGSGQQRLLGNQSPEQFFPETVTAGALLPGAPLLDEKSSYAATGNPSATSSSSANARRPVRTVSSDKPTFAPPSLLAVDETTTEPAAANDNTNEPTADGDGGDMTKQESDKFLFPVTRAECSDRYGDVGMYTGTILVTEGLPQGFGTMNYDSGRVYAGEWVVGQWNGTGKLLNPNGDTYEGEFVLDARHGKGVYHWDNGDVYTGMFRQDKRHGEGKFCFHNGNVYQGEFCDGMFDGHGRYQFDGGVYEGDWKEGKYHGNGELLYANGGKYAGEFRNSVAHGFGTEVTPSGETRRGVWEQGQPMNTSTVNTSATEQPTAQAAADGSSGGDGRPKSPPLGVD